MPQPFDLPVSEVVPFQGTIAIAHDYLQQSGGAERVVAEWSRLIPASPIHTIVYKPSNTYPIFENREVKSTLPSYFSRVELLLPLLPTISRMTRVDDAQVALVSTSGWAHQFDYRIPTVAYVHTPARWLYASADYRTRLSPTGRLALSLFDGHLRRSDRPTMSRMGALFANSRITQERIHSAYGLDSEILHPPVSAIRSLPVAPVRQLPEMFALVVSRNRGYKNTKLAVEASRLAGMPVVIVGGGTESFDEPSEGVHALGFVPDSVLRWLYRSASVLVGSSHEDFGLTPLEANLEGTPVAAIPSGGYLETIVAGENGLLSDDESPESLARAIVGASGVEGDSAIRHAEKFSLERHFAALSSRMIDLAR